MLDLRGAELLTAEAPELGDYFWARGQSIFGGTAQIQRNIVAQRLLGLPRPDPSLGSASLRAPEGLARRNE